MEASVGGFGSGRRTTRNTTDECIEIRLPYLKRLGMVKRHCMHRQILTWRCNGRVSAQLTLVADVNCHEPFPCLKINGWAFGNNVDCMVWLDCQPMHFGGERWYALCPKTGKRCTTLVLPPGRSHFASVSGWGIAYGSQRECKVHRAFRAIDKATSRVTALSKYARSSTREKLRKKIIYHTEIIDDEIDNLMVSIRREDGFCSKKRN